MKNKQWILKKFPVGEISEGDLVLEENEVPSLLDSQILIRNIYLSLDPANRGWMSGQKSYVDAMQTGDTMRGGTIGIICLLYTSPSPRDDVISRMPSSA